MTDFYVFTMYASKGYTMVTASAAEASAYEEEPDCVVFNNPSDALDWLNQAAEHFNRQAFLEYRSVLEEAEELLGRAPAAARKAEQTEPAASIAASEALEGALCLAAQSIVRALSDELSEAIENREDISRTCERIEAYRLALSALSRTLIKAERAAQEG